MAGGRHDWVWRLVNPGNIAMLKANPEIRLE